MNRLTRTFAAALLTVTTLVAAAPAAQALPLGKPQSVPTLGSGWLDAALSWLNQLFVRETPRTSQSTREKASSTPATNSGSTTTGFTGSCIDPNGCIVVERGNGNGNGGK